MLWFGVRECLGRILSSGHPRSVGRPVLSVCLKGFVLEFSNGDPQRIEFDDFPGVNFEISMLDGEFEGRPY